MNYGFVIDNRKCIGCHACSTACKAENEVPLGVNRTWVKSVEHGRYPDVTRSFQVTRCNHCDNPPCARICPVTAMYQRDDGIVEFDPNICIGCKACMQACPYDAIYIDPESETAAKCHMCSHRVDVGLEPACVVLCPEHAIIFGDMDDPESEISGVLSKHKTTVRKPEQGTAPKLFYIEGNDVVLHPTATGAAQHTFAAADVITEQGLMRETTDERPLGRAASGAKIRLPVVKQGVPSNGPIRVSQARMAEHMVQVAYNAQHKMPWHWPVPAYLLTKGIGAGLFLFLALGWGLGAFAFDALTMVVAGLIALIAIMATTGLLVYDLEQPQRFLSILRYPQWRSWLTRGAFILIGFSTLAGAWWLGETADYFGVFTMPAALRPILIWTTVPLAVGAAIYTAFLFAQAEGRDLWQSPLLPFHLIVQSLYLGTGTLLIGSALMDLPAPMMAVAKTTFVASLIVDLFVTLAGELGVPHASEVAARAAREISRGKYRTSFWWGAIALGHAVPLALMLTSAPIAGALAGLAAAIGLYFYEHAFVMAPQEVVNS